MAKRKPKKKTPFKLTVDKLFILLMVVGLAMSLAGGVKRRIYTQTMQLPAEVTLTGTEFAADDIGGLPARIMIGRVIDVTVDPVPYTSEGWIISEVGANYLLDSARLGKPGNAIMYGHNRNEILGKLTQVRVGDEVVVETFAGDLKRYVVRNVVVVSPKDVSFLQSTSEEVLTIYTCTGFLDSKRLVVQAVPV
jgi:LPXTG-site transpeptidase (sortase) family protein